MKEDGITGLPAANDAVNPKHYRQLGLYSALHVIEKWGLGFHLGNALKYIQRAGRKESANEITDLLKAKWYLERHIHLLDPSQPDPADDIALRKQLFDDLKRDFNLEEL